MFSIDFIHPTEVIGNNKAYTEYFNKRLGHTPNIYTAMMHSKNALTAYYPFHTRKSSLSKREIESITLVVSQQNNSMYCLSASTMIGKLNGFSDAEILELRTGNASFDTKLNALVQFIKNSIEQRGAVDSVLLQNFFEQGYSLENLIDALYVIGDNFITNFTDKLFDVPIDFPIAPSI